MKILAIETSCDETGISILDAHGNLDDAEFTVLSDSIASQAKLHAEYGGVYPNLAKNEHIKNLPILLEKVKEDVDLNTLDCIAVTHGPGLAPALWCGVNFASELARKLSKPIVGVNHMEGHIFSALLHTKNNFQFSIFNLKFPTLALLVSGGHTQLYLIKDWFAYKLLGETRDDAAGEAFDKVARMLGLPYPGGPYISKLATLARNEGLEALRALPRPMLHTRDYDFSFSGLKTATHNIIKDNPLGNKQKKQVAREFEDAVVDVLVKKTTRAISEFDIKTLLVAGGVSANRQLQNRLENLIASEYSNLTLHFPPANLTGDNALMIAVTGYLRALHKEYTEPRDLEARASLTLH